MVTYGFFSVYFNAFNLHFCICSDALLSSALIFPDHLCQSGMIGRCKNKNWGCQETVMFHLLNLTFRPAN